MLIERKEHKEDNGDIGYIESVFNSGNVLRTTYFPKSERLYIAFNRGHTYSYGNISNDLYDDFENTDSQGVFFQKKLNNPKLYPCRKEFSLYPAELSELKNIVENHKMLEEEDE